MRRPLIAGNWKMNLNGAEATSLGAAVRAGVSGANADVVLCPPFVYLAQVARALDGSTLGTGAQNVSASPNGALTGEISIPMCLDCGASHVILGHSERRQMMGETDPAINQKLLAVLGSTLIPIVCVGETLEERESGQTLEVVQRQCQGAFLGVSEEMARRVILAYEPVWAIGTGKTASPAQAQEVHGDLRKWLENRYNAALSQAVRILYGGSVKGSNAVELLTQPDIDGALVGGASLKADEFLQIIAAAN